MKDFLGSHLEDDVRVGAHPDALRGDVAQQGVKTGAASTVLNRVDPDEHAVQREQLFADLLGEALVVDRGPRLDADSGERFEDADEAAVPRGRIAASSSVAP